MLSVEEFKKEVDELWREGRRMLGREGEVSHRLDIWDAAGERPLVMGRNPQRAGDSTAPQIPAALQKLGGVRFINIPEGWSRTATSGYRPTADPGREEARILRAAETGD